MGRRDLVPILISRGPVVFAVSGVGYATQSAVTNAIHPSTSATNFLLAFTAAAALHHGTVEQPGCRRGEQMCPGPQWIDCARSV